MELAIGVIGSGARASDAVRFESTEHDARIRVAAIADIEVRNANKFKRLYGYPDTAIYTDYRKMLECEKLDGVVIGTPNYAHVEPAVDVMERGIPLLLEKPIATTLEDCKKLLEVHRRTKSQVTVGFVLRYTPFYRKVKEVVDSGVIGQIMSINAEELMSRGLTQVFFRGWRSSYEKSGGLLLEKCCHDIDILNWLVGDYPKSVSSFSSGTKVFRSKPEGAADKCSKCSIKAACDYNYWFFYEKYFAATDASIEDTVEGRHIKYAMYSDDSCVYDNPNFDLGLEAQSVSIVYGNGIPVHFSMVMAQEWSHRGIHILGSRGRIFGDPDNNKFFIFTGCHDHDTDKEEVVEIPVDDSGHYGGDRVIAGEFIRSILDRSYQPKASIEEGYESAALCLAAEAARLNNHVVDLDEQLWGFAQEKDGIS